MATSCIHPFIPTILNTTFSFSKTLKRHLFAKSTLSTCISFWSKSFVAFATLLVWRDRRGLTGTFGPNKHFSESGSVREQNRRRWPSICHNFGEASDKLFFNETKPSWMNGSKISITESELALFLHKLSAFLKSESVTSTSLLSFKFCDVTNPVGFSVFWPCFFFFNFEQSETKFPFFSQ